jgi:hypothetical protein
MSRVWPPTGTPGNTRIGRLWHIAFFPLAARSGTGGRGGFRADHPAGSVPDRIAPARPFYTSQQADALLELNDLKFLARRSRQAAGMALAAVPAFSRDLILALSNGPVWVFRGRRATGKAPVVVASRCSMSSPERLRRAAGEHELVLAAFIEVPKPPSDKLLGLLHRGRAHRGTDRSQVAAGQGRRLSRG